MGVFQKIVWIRLKPHHSHNLSDRANSFHKEVMTPKRGTGGGCKAPWEMDSVVKKALQSQAGMCVPCLAQHTLPVVHARCCTHTRVPMMTFHVKHIGDLQRGGGGGMGGDAGASQLAHTVIG